MIVNNRRNHLVMRYIVGYKKEESDMLLNFLNNHITLGADFQARVKWQEKSVMIIDVSYQPLNPALSRWLVIYLTVEQNRVAGHSAILDWVNGQRRYLARITPLAKKPYETPFEGD